MCSVQYVVQYVVVVTQPSSQLEQPTQDIGVRQVFPRDTKSFRDVGVVHLGVSDRQSTTLALRPDHELLLTSSVVVLET